MDIRRDYIIRDALVQVILFDFIFKKIQLENRKGYDLKKQLRITFVGEDGIDEGGVQKEFFKIAMECIFDPEYGMFHMNSGKMIRI